LSTTKKMEPSLPRSKARRRANEQISQELQFRHNGHPGERKPAAVDLDVLNGHLGYFARRAQLSIFQDFIRTLSIVDIRPAQYAVLVVIGANPGLPQITLGNTLGIERGRLVDVITDMHQYFFGRKVALAGDPDQLISLTEFLVSLDMWPIHIVSGTPGKKFEAKIKEITRQVPHPVNVKSGGDLFLLHQWLRNDPVDLLMGNTYLKYVARDEDIPLVRFGFPIMDRVGHSYFPTVGYRGGLRLLEKILDALLDRQDRDAPEERFELVM